MHVEFLLNRLQDAGYEAYVVGGCVRDSLMDIAPHDWDICTSALPEQVMQIFEDKNVVPTGIKHGTVTVILEPYSVGVDNAFEITTYRIEGDYKDNRHPEYLEFVSDLSLDLMRRDFTINAMAYNHQDGLVDLYGGVDDIKDRVIKCVGNPDDRFQEDALRIIRTLRFALRFGFDIDLETYNAMQRNKYLLKNISAERISSELVKIISSTDFSGSNKRIVEYLLKTIDIYINEDIVRDIDLVIEELVGAKGNIPVALSAIFDYENIEDILKRLRFSNDIVDATVTINEYGYKILYESHYWANNGDIGKSLKDCSIELRYYARKLLNSITSCPVESVIDFAKPLTKGNKYLRIYLERLKAQVRYCIEYNEVYKISYLAVNGNDLLNLGYKGKEIGNALNQLLDMVMKEEVQNVKEDLLYALRVIENNKKE